MIRLIDTLLLSPHRLAEAKLGMVELARRRNEVVRLIRMGLPELTIAGIRVRICSLQDYDDFIMRLRSEILRLEGGVQDGATNYGHRSRQAS